MGHSVLYKGEIMKKYILLIILSVSLSSGLFGMKSGDFAAAHSSGSDQDTSEELKSFDFSLDEAAGSDGTADSQEDETELDTDSDWLTSPDCSPIQGGKASKPFEEFNNPSDFNNSLQQINAAVEQSPFSKVAAKFNKIDSKTSVAFAQAIKDGAEALRKFVQKNLLDKDANITRFPKLLPWFSLFSDLQKRESLKVLNNVLVKEVTSVKGLLDKDDPLLRLIGILWAQNAGLLPIDRIKNSKLVFPPFWDIAHIAKPKIHSKSGKATGYHLEQAKGTLYPVNIIIGNPIIVYGGTWGPDHKYSSFFPRHWAIKDVMTQVQEVMKNPAATEVTFKEQKQSKRLLPDNCYDDVPVDAQHFRFLGKAEKGDVWIEVIFDATDGCITTAYPILAVCDDFPLQENSAYRCSIDNKKFTYKEVSACLKEARKPNLMQANGKLMPSKHVYQTPKFDMWDIADTTVIKNKFPAFAKLDNPRGIYIKVCKPISNSLSTSSTVPKTRLQRIKLMQPKA